MQVITPDWPVDPCVKSVFTTRIGGNSTDRYRGLNLGLHVGDDSGTVESNRLLVRTTCFPRLVEPFYMNQIHSTRCVDAALHDAVPDADASVTTKANSALAVLTADCLPVFLSTQTGDVLAVAHAGWRGLANGVIAEAVRAMRSAGAQALFAWLGPAIGPCHYEVKEDVRRAFSSATGFMPDGNKLMMDLYTIARQQLTAEAVSVHGGGYCTYCDEARFFSYRRDGVTGRMGGFLWRQG